jgi:hypothetical protein
MIKINKKIVDLLLDLDFSNVGYCSEYGAVIGDAEFIVYYNDGEDIPYLAHISEFEVSGILVKLKNAMKGK